jgi:hypothetical protein
MSFYDNLLLSYCLLIHLLCHTLLLSFNTFILLSYCRSIHWHRGGRPSLDQLLPGQVEQVFQQHRAPLWHDTQVCITIIGTLILTNYTNDAYLFDTYTLWHTQRLLHLLYYHTRGKPYTILYRRFYRVFSSLRRLSSPIFPSLPLSILGIPYG